MAKIVDMEQRRNAHELKLKDTRTGKLRDDLANASQKQPDQQQSTQKLLNIFKRKPAPKR